MAQEQAAFEVIHPDADDMVRFVINVPPATKQKIAEIAKQNGVTSSELARQMLQYAISNM